jgi:deazaflavin-dependent oxidoreductase (nitroreductase family)
MKLMWRIHRAVYKATNGRIGGRITLPVLLLNVTGRKSGRTRTAGLYYLEDGDDLFVIASNAGEDYHPAWWLNLRDNPTAAVQIGKEEFPVVAHEADGEERVRLWTKAVEADPAYATYEDRTTRRIPVVVLKKEG